jgi:hypothetical protein
MMIQSDELIFFRGVGIPPSSNMLGVSKKWDPKVTIDGVGFNTMVIHDLDQNGITQF